MDELNGNLAVCMREGAVVPVVALGYFVRVLLAEFALVPVLVVEELDLIVAHFALVALDAGLQVLDVLALVKGILVNRLAAPAVVIVVVVDAVLEVVLRGNFAHLGLEGGRIK